MAGSKITIPDWRLYKVDGIESLEWTKTMLQQRGLRDPWLRNEVWRYKHWPGYGKLAWSTFKKGMKWAGAAMVITVLVDKALGVTDGQSH